jgi:hypothetical protein
VGERLRKEYNIRVDFATHIRTWSQGVIYGRVASEHKPPEELDKTPTQWSPSGTHARLEESIPVKWQASGFVRPVKMTALAFLDVCKENDINSEEDAWALAARLEGKGEKGVMAYLLECKDVGAAIERVQKAKGASSKTARSKMTRLQILEAAALEMDCTCTLGEGGEDGLWHKLAKDMLQKNELDGPFQNALYRTLHLGRAKKTNLFLVGGSDCGKSFVLKPLSLIFRTYTKPDSGSYQLSSIVNKELVFLNDFEFDADVGKTFMSWQYLKNFFEDSSSLTVGRPKNKGDNVEWTSDAPVVGTAPQKIALYRNGKQRDDGECKQMDNRVSYLFCHHVFAEVDIKKCKPCGKCGAKLYLEGRGVSGGTSNGASSSSRSTPSDPMPKKAKTAQEVVSAISDLGNLKDKGLIDSQEFKMLKERLLRGE